MLIRNGIKKGERVKMLKKLFSLGILLFILGCEDRYYLVGPEPTIYPEVKLLLNPRLEQDENGFYHLPMSRGSWQTIHRIAGVVIDVDTTTYIEGLRVKWESSHYWYIGDTLGYVVKQTINSEGQYVYLDTSYVIGFNGMEVPTTNQVSISNYWGEVNNMIAPVQTMIGDTMKVWAYYKSDVNWETLTWDTLEIPIVLD